MSVGETYPAAFVDSAGVDRFIGNVLFTDSTDQPAPNGNVITSGTLPDTGNWSSGTAKVNPVSRNITVAVEVVGDATNNAATCAIAISPNNSDYTTLGTVSFAAAVNNTGAIKSVVPVPLPQGWYIKLTLSHTTVAASFYY